MNKIKIEYNDDNSFLLIKGNQKVISKKEYDALETIKSLLATEGIKLDVESFLVR